MNDKKQQGRPRSRFTAKEILGYLAIIAVVVGFPMLILKLLEPPAAGSYQHYASPILPLSSLSGGERVEAERLLTLDFGVYEEEEYRYQEEVLVTDTYTLTNPTAENVTVELSWPIVTDLSGEAPVISVDGQRTDARLLLYTVRERSLYSADDFEQYCDIYLTENFMENGLEPTPEWDVPVKVYHFYNIAYEGDQANAWLKVSGKYGKTTNLWTRTYGACTEEKGGVEIIFMTGEDAWLYVIGDDLEDMTINGSLYRNLGGIEQQPEVEGVTFELETYESTFMECLWEAAAAYVPEDATSGTELVTAEMRYDYAMRRIVDSGNQLPGGFHDMDTLFYKLYTNKQMIYWLFPVEIPAGGSVTVSATYRQQSNYNSSGQRHGYDIATTLGSNLNFASQRVRLVNTDPVTIAEQGEAQNLGVNLNTGVLEAELDLTQERYFIDLEREK